MGDTGTTTKTAEERIAALLDRLEDPTITESEIKKLQKKIEVIKAANQ